jgi:hypothetical protein
MSEPAQKICESINEDLRKVAAAGNMHLLREFQGSFYSNSSITLLLLAFMREKLSEEEPVAKKPKIT